MKAVWCVLLALGLAVAGCGSRGASPAGGGQSDSPLRGRTFLSTAVTDGGKPYQLAEKSRVRLQFTDDGRLIADAGCNSMQGQVNLRGSRIEVSELGATAMGCPAPLMEQDTWLSRFLSSKPEWRLDDATLVVSSPTTSMTLTDRKVAEPALPLLGTKWTVDTLVTGEVASSTPQAAIASLQFDKDTVQVSAGCNSGSGTYTLSGNTIRIGSVATTRKACEPDVMTLENAVLAVLQGDVEYQIDADRLILKQATGKGLQLRGQRG